MHYLTDKRNVMISRGWLIWTVERDSVVSPMLHAAGSLAYSEFSYWSITSIYQVECNAIGPRIIYLAHDI